MSTKADRTPDVATAAGMLAGIRSQHTCTEACTGTVVIGRASATPEVRTLTCPWSRIDLDDPADRRVVQVVYVDMAREGRAL